MAVVGSSSSIMLFGRWPSACSKVPPKRHTCLPNGTQKHTTSIKLHLRKTGNLAHVYKVPSESTCVLRIETSDSSTGIVLLC